MYYHVVAIIVAMVKLVIVKAVVVVIAVITAVLAVVVLVLGVTRYCKYYECKLASTLPNIKKMRDTSQQNNKANTTRCGNPGCATLLEICRLIYLTFLTLALGRW